MKNFIFTAVGGVLALVIFVLGLVFGEFVNKIKNSNNAPKTEQITASKLEITELEITEQIEYALKAKPDLYKANPTFYTDELDDNDKNTINTRFSGILTLVKENGLCSGGAYETYSEQSRNNDNGTKTKLSSRLDCAFKEGELEKYNELIAGIENLIESSPIKLHLAKINPTFSDEAKQKNANQIKEGLIKKAKENAQILSKNFAKNCELKNIDFGYSHFVGANMAMRDGAIKVAVSAPELSEQLLNGNANAKYICK